MKCHQETRITRTLYTTSGKVSGGGGKGGEREKGREIGIEN